MDKVPGPPAPTTHTPILLGPRTSGKPASQGTRHPLRPRLGDKDRSGWAAGRGGEGRPRLATQGAGPAPRSPSRRQEAGNHRKTSSHLPSPLVCDALDSALVDESTRSQGLALGQSHHTATPASLRQQPVHSQPPPASEQLCPRARGPPTELQEKRPPGGLLMPQEERAG